MFIYFEYSNFLWSIDTPCSEFFSELVCSFRLARSVEGVCDALYEVWLFVFFYDDVEVVDVESSHFVAFFE